jgi:hypothetical protein
MFEKYGPSPGLVFRLARDSNMETAYEASIQATMAHLELQDLITLFTGAALTKLETWPSITLVQPQLLGDGKEYIPELHSHLQSTSWWRQGSTYKPVSNYVEGLLSDELFSADWPRTEYRMKTLAKDSARLEAEKEKDPCLESASTSRWAHYSHLWRLYCHRVVPSVEHLVLNILDSIYDGKEKPLFYFSCPIGTTLIDSPGQTTTSTTLIPSIPGYYRPSISIISTQEEADGAFHSFAISPNNELFVFRFSPYAPAHSRYPRECSFYDAFASFLYPEASDEARRVRVVSELRRMSCKYVFVVPKGIQDYVYAETFKEATSEWDHGYDQRVSQFVVGLDLIDPRLLHTGMDVEMEEDMEEDIYS